ncbi:pilus biogenesis protein, TadE family [Cystobacter fuscus]|uniref:Pilus biogenesis protein, TadE family n=1 Tax=Cystobacter fuscus TaxID=43 RepID=A0A250JE43_9BACT|nr:TadE family protein [Cystobacter fuscus]ATB41762.1 pilus biogenesis protein, TadE family [Cystobacter fuscus]
MNHPLAHPRANLRARRLPARRGSSTVEFAIMAPLLVVLVLWSNYFWEVLRVRIKVAEAARFIAFERTARKDLGQITAEAQSRYQDLNGSDSGVALGSGFRNKLTLSFSASDKPAPVTGSMSGIGSSAGVGGMLGMVTSLVGSSVEGIVGQMGFDPSKGAVQSTVTARMENRIIPERIGQYITGFSDNKLNVGFTESVYVYHDTWRAWQPGDNPKNNQGVVESRVRERVQKVAYMGLLGSAAGSALSAIGTVLSLFKLEYPFNNDFINKAVLVRKVPDSGYFSAPSPAGNRPTRTVPGDVLQAAYWESDDQACFNSCEPDEIKNKRGVKNGGGRDDNWPMRAYNCRGPFFQGASKSDEPESVYSQVGNLSLSQSYFRYDGNACAEDPNASTH